MVHTIVVVIYMYSEVYYISYKFGYALTFRLSLRAIVIGFGYILKFDIFIVIYLMYLDFNLYLCYTYLALSHVCFFGLGSGRVTSLM